MGGFPDAANMVSATATLLFEPWGCAHARP